jgi:hypothetical protein
MPAIDMIEQEFQQVVGLIIVIPYNTLCIRAVDEEILPACDRMHRHHGMHRARYWTADDGCRPIVTKFARDGVRGGVDGSKTFETLAERRGELGEGSLGLSNSIKSISFNSIP